MQKIGLLLLVSGLLTGPAHAQIHLSGQRFIDIQAGLADGFRPTGERTGLYSLVSTGRYNRHYNAWKTTIAYGHFGLTRPLLDEKIPVSQYTLGYGYEFNLWRNATRTAFVRGLVQPFAGYESVNRDRPVSATATDSTATYQTSRLLVGGDIGLEIEFSPVVLGLRQRWQPTSAVERFHTLLFIGWRFHR
jgi:hypothetical protein